MFRGAGLLAATGDPRCPSASSVRLATSASGIVDVPLPCGNWRAARGGFVYVDRSGAAAGLRRIVLRPELLLMRFGGPAYSPIQGPLVSFEVALTIGNAGVCGRYSRFPQNGATTVVGSGPTEPCRFPRPNIIVVVLDDARFDGLDGMPVALSELAEKGVAFTNAFVSNAVCCPSRASILTGEYSVRHGTREVAGPIGGAHVFRETGADQQTMATWLHAAGYRTGLFGKYLNAYAQTEQNKGPGGTFYVPPGWDRWWAFVSPEHYGGINGSSYNIVDEHGQVTSFTDHSTDAQYSTDVSAHELRAFVAEAVAEGRPFLAYWAPYAPHGETPNIVPAPAVRYQGMFDWLPLWRPPSWNESDVTDKPRWINVLQETLATPSGAFARALTDETRRLQYETLLAVDEDLGLILDDLAALGVDQDTLILLTSDNGLGWGEHQIFAIKECPYEECIRVPLIVRYPRRVAPVPTGDPTLATNIDIAPTVADFAEAEVTLVPDGESLRRRLLGIPPATTRSEFLIEHFGGRDSPLTYTGQVTDGDVVRIYYGDPRAQPRASVVFEFDGGDGVTPGRIAVPIGATDDETFASFAGAITAAVPGTGTTLNTNTNRLDVFPTDPLQNSNYVWEEIDQGGVIDPLDWLPEYFGLRDLAGGFSWVEYETGERELYDLTVDPDQLESKADDPAYASVRQALAQRLEALLQEVRSR